MTIIKPNKQKKEAVWVYAFSLIGISLVLSVIFRGYIYSKTVGLKYEMASLENRINAGKTDNAELKNVIFKMTDPQILEAIAEEKGLVKDKNPQWVFASL